MEKVSTKLIDRFYYGNDLTEAFSKITDKQNVNFIGLGYDDSDGVIKDIEIDGEFELDESTTDFMLKGEVKENMIIFTNDYNDTIIVYNLKTNEYIY